MEAINTTFLLGAGASVATGLPTAYSLIDELSERIIKKAWASDEVKRLARNDRFDQRDESDFIRFETLLYWIEAVYGNINFFEFLEQYNNPSTLQQSIVNFSRGGAKIITPNFDDLLENAYKRCGINPTTIDINSVADINMSFSLGDVIKLHGSWNYHKTGIIEKSRKPIHATVDVIISESPGNMLNLTAKKIFKQIIDGSELVVVGYSASDMMDIVPALFECSPQKVHWVNYSDCIVNKYEISDYLHTFSHTSLHKWESLLKHWSDNSSEVYVYCGRAEDAIEQIGIVLASSVTHYDGTTWRKTIKQWEKSVRRNDPTGLGLSGLLFAELNLYDKSTKAIKESFGYRDSNCGWSSAKRLYEVAQNSYFTDVDVLPAIKQSKKAIREARKIHDQKTFEYSLLLLGRCYFWSREWGKALDIFHSPDFSRFGSTYQCFCKSWIGRTYLWSRRPRKALQYLPSACRNLQRTGDIDGLVDAEFALGVCKMHLGDYIAAKTILETNDLYCNNHGLLSQRISALIELSRIKIIYGNITDAETDIDSAITLAKTVPYDEMTTLQLGKAEISILKCNYIGALPVLEDAIDTINQNTNYYLTDILAKKSLCQFMMGNMVECQTTLMQIESLDLISYSYFGFVMAYCIMAKLTKIKKTFINELIKLSKLNAVERFELILYCRRLNFSTTRINVVAKRVSQTLQNNHMLYWLNEIERS